MFFGPERMSHPAEVIPMAPATPSRTRSSSTRRAAVSAVAASLVLASLAGCGGEGTAAARWNGTVDTLPSGAIHVRNPATGAWGAEDRVRLVENLRIGSVEGGGPEGFGAVGAVTADDLGRIYVLERQAAEVRVFDADGRHVRTIGGRGGGPGELMSPTALLWSPEGHLWVHDPRNQRYQIFDTAGAPAGSQPIEGLAFGFAGAAFGEDGLLYEMVPIPEGDELRQVMVRYRLEGARRVPLDTLRPPVLPPVERIDVFLEMPNGARGRIRIPVPLQNNPSRRIDRHGYFWANHGGDTYRLLQEGFDGDTLRIVEREHEPVEITEDEVDEALEGLPGGAGDGLDRNRIPEVHPPLQTFWAGDDGSLWVRRYAAPGRQVLDYFDPEGRYMGEVALELDPGHFTPHHITADAVYGVLLDELDVPWVVRLRIEEGEG